MKFKFLLFFPLLYASLQAQVSINEFTASNIRTHLDNYEKGEDWIELFNNSEGDVDLSGYFLSDKDSKPKKWMIPSGTTIKAKGFLSFYASGRDESYDGIFHTNFRFTQTAGDEYIVLADRSGKIIESIKLPITHLSHSVGKEEDGVGNKLVFFEEASFDKTNAGKKFYTSYAKTPKIDVKPGSYKGQIAVNVTDNEGFTSRYTLDGTNPTAESEMVDGPIILVETVILKVANFSNDSKVHNSHMAFATYFIDEPESTLPIISVASEQAELLANGERELKPIASFEYFDKDGNFIARSFGEMDSHGQDSWINPQRSLDWISRDEMGYDSGIEAKLFTYSKREDYQRVILRASGDDNYPSVGDEDHEGSTHVRDEFVHQLVQDGDMKMDVRASERVLVYINGKYWGVYAIREKPDDSDYTDYTYKQGKYDIQFLKTWGQSWAEYGGDKAFEDWGKLRDFILKNDMSNEDNYNKVLEEYNVTSLMDYMIANLSVVSSDWLNYNTGWWRGLDKDGDHKKWAYIMWDNDATFDYYINYSGVPNISPNAEACDIDEISEYMDEFFPEDSMFIKYDADSFFIDGEWVYFPADSFWQVPDPGKHEKIFLKLLEENSTFRNQYYARYANMNSTIFSCDHMLSTLDSMVAMIRPEMPRHILRWGGTMTEWENNVKRLRKFISDRCKVINKGIVNCYDELSGPYKVTLITDPPNAGSIAFNELDHAALPWSGDYFGGMPNSIEVKPKPNEKFKKWFSKNGKTSFENINELSTIANLTSGDTLIAVFESGLTTTKELSSLISISPNPAYDYINVSIPSYDDYKFSLTNNLGVVVMEGILSSNRISVNSLPSGLYLFNISQDFVNVYQQKVIIVK